MKILTPKTCALCKYWNDNERKRTAEWAKHVPPWDVPVVKTLNCHQRDRFVCVELDHPQLVKRRRLPEEGA